VRPSRPFLRSMRFALLLLATCASSLELAGKDGSNEQPSKRSSKQQPKKQQLPVVSADDHYGHLRINPTATYATTALLTVAATALQIAPPSWVQRVLGPACEHGLGKAVLSCVRTVDGLKQSHPLGLTMGHGFLLKAIAEALSQVLSQRASAVVWLDPLRLVRSTIASLLSSSLSFYYWTRLRFVRQLAAPGFMRGLFGATLGTSITKMVVTQAIYRPINVFLFLVAQSFFRGDSARKLVHVIRTKFKGGLVGGIVFFAFSNMFMFSIPAPFLHPIIGALAGLIFNVWLAMVAYEPAKGAAPPSPAAATAATAATAAASEGYGLPHLEELAPTVAAFPATSAALSAIGLLEAVAAARLHAQSGHAAKPLDNGALPSVPMTPRAPVA